MKISGNSIIDRQQPDPRGAGTQIGCTDGRLALSDKPGFGVELDEDGLKATRFA
jgi:L-alanine-DL-glutamate epimerase-like enolase superfamily enzyme